MRGPASLAGSALPALLAGSKRLMVGRTALPQFDVGTDSGAGYGDQFFTTWPSEEEVW